MVYWHSTYNSKFEKSTSSGNHISITYSSTIVIYNIIVIIISSSGSIGIIRIF